MSVLSSGDLSRMRTQLETTLPDSGTISRRSTTDDGMGGQVETWNAVGTVSCRISPQDLNVGYETDQGGAVTTVAQRVITLPHDTSIDAADRILSGGSTYEVKNIRAPRSYELSRRVNAVEVG